jgi:hypothetical protein
MIVKAGAGFVDKTSGTIPGVPPRSWFSAVPNVHVCPESGCAISQFPGGFGGRGKSCCRSRLRVWRPRRIQSDDRPVQGTSVL